MSNVFDELGLKRWLVVDDQDLFREIGTRILRSFDLEVRTACSGDEALLVVEAEEFDAILIDGQMPGLSGYETARAIRGNPSANISSVVIVLSTDDANHAELARDSEMDASFSKPTSKEKLIDALRAVRDAQKKIVIRVQEYSPICGAMRGGRALMVCVRDEKTRTTTAGSRSPQARMPLSSTASRAASVRITAASSVDSNVETRRPLSAATNPWRDGIALRHRYSIFPVDVERLRVERAGVLVTHEAPSFHQHGWKAIDHLAEAVRVRLMVHGHHREERDYAAEDRQTGELGPSAFGVAPEKVLLWLADGAAEFSPRDFA